MSLELCRAALYPKFLHGPVFDEQLLLQFTEVGDTQVYAMSVASKLICRTEDGVHSYGSSAADIMNGRFREKNGRDPEPVTEEVHYVGYYSVTFEDLISVRMEYYRVDCRWLPEHGQLMHYQAEFKPNGRGGTKRERRNDRLTAAGVMADKIWGPTRHICQKDEPHRKALEAIDLPDRPRKNAV